MILALDQATVTGWAFGGPAGPVQIGHFKSKGSSPNDIGGFVDDFSAQLDSLINRLAPAAVVFEQPIRGGSKMNLATLRKLYSIAAEIERVSKRHGLPCVEVDNNEVKKTAYGKIPRGQKEAVAIPRIKLWGFEATTHDEADACAIWLEYVSLFHPEAFQNWLARRAA